MITTSGRPVSRGAAMGSVFGLGGLILLPVLALTLSEPAVAALLAVVVVGEQLSGSGWVGMACVALALVVLVAPRPRARRRTQPGAQPRPASRRRSTAAR